MSRLQMPRISGAVPQQSYAPTPIAGGTPGSIQAAYNQNFQTADQINRGLAGSIEKGFQDIAGSQRDAQDLLGAGFADMGARARQRQEEMRSTIIGDPSKKFDAGHLGRLQDAFDWQQDAHQRQAAGYKQLYGDAMGDVEGLGQTERMDLEERYRQAQGQSTQNLASRGLGNSTIRSQQERGIDFDRARAGIALQDTLARERLDVRGRFGMAEQQAAERRDAQNREQQNLIGTTRAGFEQRIREFGAGQELGAYGDSLAAQERGIGRNTALGQDQLQWMNSIQAPYPNAGQYAALASAAGQAGVDPFGGGGFGGAGIGGHTVTRGAPWAGGQPTMRGGGGAPAPDPQRGSPIVDRPRYVSGPGGQMVDSAWASAYMPHLVEQYQGGGGVAGPGPVPAQGGSSSDPLSSGGGYAPSSGFGGGFGGYQQPTAPTYEGAGEDWLLDQQLAQEQQAPVDWLFGSDVE